MILGLTVTCSSFAFGALAQEGSIEIPDPSPANDAIEEAEADPIIKVRDITGKEFRRRSPDCADYAGYYTAFVTNEGGGPDALEAAMEGVEEYQSAVVIDVSIDRFSCSLISDNIPSHDFNDETAGFRDPINEVGRDFTIPRNPEFADTPTEIAQETYDGVFLNGVPIDQLGAGCYRPDSDDPDLLEEFGTVGGGCSADEEYFLLDVFHPNNRPHYLLDVHNGHPQTLGDYHYHGNPAQANLHDALFNNEKAGREGSPVIGFAPDGFPIYGPYFKAEYGEVRRAVSGYTLKEGTREETAPADLTVPNPGGEHDGMYISDYEFTDAGDLDECNGMTVDGQYGYYITDSYPYILNCYRGTPDPSFDK